MHYSRKTARLFPNYALRFCGTIIYKFCTTPPSHVGDVANIKAAQNSGNHADAEEELLRFFARGGDEATPSTAFL